MSSNDWITYDVISQNCWCSIHYCINELVYIDAQYGAALELAMDASIIFISGSIYQITHCYGSNGSKP